MVKDIFFYSTHCQFSGELLTFIQKNGLVDQLSFICVGNRTIDSKTNATLIILPNGQYMPLPIHVNRVPTLMLVNEKNIILVGRDILKRFDTQPTLIQPTTPAEPIPASDVKTDAFTSGLGGVAYNSTKSSTLSISTPFLDNGSQRLKEGDITVEQIQSQRDIQTEQILNI